MDVIFLVIGLSLVLQFFAAFLALRLAPLSGVRLGWWLITAALLLMAIRRVIVMTRILQEGNMASLDLAAEILALVLSAFFVTGLAILKPMFASMNATALNLRATEQKFRALVSSTEEGVIVLDPSGNISFASPRLGEWFNVPTDQIIGRHVKTLFDAEDHPSLETRLRTRARGIAEQYEIKVKGRDGSPRWALVIGIPLLDEKNRFTGSLAIITDITQRKRETDAIQAEKERLRVTLRSIGEGVITTDDTGNIDSINRAAETLTGWPVEEALGRPLAETLTLVHEETRAAFPDPFRQFIQEGEKALTPPCLLIDRQGREIPVAMTGCPIRDNRGTEIGGVLVFRDLRFWRRMDEEVIRASKLESLSLVASGIAHDFNNMLTAISGNLHLVRASLIPGGPAEARIEAADLACRRARDMTAQLLTFSKAGAPVKEVNRAERLLEEAAVLALRGSAQRCRMDIAPGIWNVLADPGQAIQAIHHLVVNAVQAMSGPGEILLAAENRTMASNEVKDLPAGDYVQITVRDQGSGISPEHLDRIFEPFFTTKNNASGLGLSCVWSIAQRHDGGITIASTPGEGTTARLFLPATRVEIPYAPVATKLPPPPGGRALVMDDEPLVREVALDLLERLGFEVALAENGQQAIDLYQRARTVNKPFDVVIMDLTIPGAMGGKEAMARLKELDPGVKAIVSSGYSTDPVMSHYREYGFSGVLPKPYLLDDLARALNQVLETGNVNKIGTFAGSSRPAGAPAQGDRA